MERNFENLDVQNGKLRYLFSNNDPWSELKYLKILREGYFLMKNVFINSFSGAFLTFLGTLLSWLCTY